MYTIYFSFILSFSSLYELRSGNGNKHKVKDDNLQMITALRQVTNGKINNNQNYHHRQQNMTNVRRQECMNIINIDDINYFLERSTHINENNYKIIQNMRKQHA